MGVNMVNPSAEMFMVRAGEDGFMLPRFLDEGVAYIGWGDVGPVVPTDSKEDIRRRLDRMDPIQGPGARPNIVGMLRRFCCEIRVGDVLVTYDPRMRQYHLGIVTSDADIELTPWRDDYVELAYVRSVDWVHGWRARLHGQGAIHPGDLLSRDSLSVATRNGLNGQLSCFKVSDGVRRELLEGLSRPYPRRTGRPYPTGWTAETTYTPFQSEPDAAPVRLIVRRVQPTPGSQLALFATYSYHGCITDREGETLELEADHRRHAEIENAIRDLKYGVGLNHLPSGRFAANGAWLAVQVMAHNLARWTARLGLGEQIVTTKTLRRRFFSIAGRLTRSARRLTLHLPKRWPWENQFSGALARLRAIPLPA